MKPNISWKDKRIKAMNRKIKAYARASKARTEYYLDEYYAVISSKAKTLLEFKKEMLLKKVYSL
jgi:ABC-type phosphate transport system substrate-binding protein